LNRVRYNFFIFIVIFLFIVAIIKAFDISIVKHNQYSKKYFSNIVKVVYSKGKRGSIYGRKNSLFALDYCVYDFFVDPKYYIDNMLYYRNKEDTIYIKRTEKFMNKVSELLNIKPSDIKSIIEKNKNKRFVILKKGVKADIFKEMSELFMPRSFGFVKRFERYYPDGEYSSHNIGFCFANGKGAEGIERYYDNYLKPEVRKENIPLDLYKYRFSNKPDDGYDIYLTLNRDIQDFVHMRLKKTIEKHEADGGIVIVMNPKDGSIIAMDSYPFYDNNNYKNYKYNQIRNRAVADVFEPGSVFKLITMSAALDSGIFKGDEIVYCENGSWKIKNKVIHDVHKYKWLSFDKVFVYSSNIGSAKIALELGRKTFYQYLNRFGFGSKTGIDTISESKGIVKDMFGIGDVDLATMAFGQGISITAIQLAKSYSVIANGGYAVKPHFLDTVKYYGKISYVYKIHRKRILNDSTVKKVKDILKKVVEQGTGKRAMLKHYVVAGKTGTAQVPKKGSYETSKYVASFAGFAPFDNPKIVIVVSIFNPKKNGFYGGSVAAPLFKEIAKFSLNYLAVKKDK